MTRSTARRTPDQTSRTTPIWRGLWAFWYAREVSGKPRLRGMSVDHPVTKRSTYERIHAGDLDGFGEMVAEDYVEHQGGVGFAPTGN